VLCAVAAMFTFTALMGSLLALPITTTYCMNAIQSSIYVT
jgi:hypothetical protein